MLELTHVCTVTNLFLRIPTTEKEPVLDQINRDLAAFESFLRVTIPLYKYNDKITGTETAKTEHECAAFCNLNIYSGKSCEMFIFDSATETCNMGNFASNAGTTLVEGTTVVYVKKCNVRKHMWIAFIPMEIFSLFRCCNI